MTASQTDPMDSRAVPGWSGAASLAVAGLLLAALFLAHGVQCAAALGPGPAPMTHVVLPPALADHEVHVGVAGDNLDLMTLLTPVGELVHTLGGGSMPGTAGAVCVAILIGAGIWLLARRLRLACRIVPSWSAGPPYTRLAMTARMRLSPPDLSVLCVLRT